MWNGVRGIDEVGRKDRNRKLRKTRSGKKEHIRIATESKDIVVPDRGWNSTTLIIQSYHTARRPVTHAITPFYS